MAMQWKQVYLKEGLAEECYPLILRWFRDIELMKYVSFSHEALALESVDDLREWLVKNETGPVFGIYTKGRKFIGYTSLSDCAGKKESEFSIFILDKENQGKGMGRETTRLMLDYAFHTLGLEKVTLETSEFHEKALRAYDHSGFRRTGFVPNDRTVFHDGTWVESGSVLMEITKEEYENF